MPEKTTENPYASDLARVQAAVDGDEAAYAAIVAEFQPATTRLMWRFTRDPGKLEELVHDAFVEVYYSLPKYRGAGPLGGWIRTIAVRVGYKFWKHKKRDTERQAIHEQIAATTPPDALTDTIPEEPEEAHRALYDSLALLGPRDRLVLTLLYWENCTTEEAAALSGWSSSMVRVQAFRARKRLKKLLEAKKNGTV